MSPPMQWIGGRETRVMGLLAQVLELAHLLRVGPEASPARAVPSIVTAPVFLDHCSLAQSECSRASRRFQ